MKKSFLIFAGGALLFASCNNQSNESAEAEVVGEPAAEVAAEPALEEVWATERALETPESVFYDPEAEILYVSNIVGEPNTKDGEGFISKVSLDGEIVEKEWVTGLDAPKGMAMLDGILYVTNVDELVAIDVEKGEIANRYTVKNSKFLNDPVAADGKILFTDMLDNKIYAFQDGKIELWKEGLERPNGLAYNDGKVLVATSNLEVVSQEGENQVLAEGIGAGDGIGVVGENSYLVSDWNGVVYYVGPDNQKIELLNTKDQKINTADIEYIRDRNLLLVPTFVDNRVVAYTLTGVE